MVVESTWQTPQCKTDKNDNHLTKRSNEWCVKNSDKIQHDWSCTSDFAPRLLMHPSSMRVPCKLSYHYAHKWWNCNECDLPIVSAYFSLLISFAILRNSNAWLAISPLAKFDVITKMASLHSMVFPCPSVSRP